MATPAPQQAIIPVPAQEIQKSESLAAYIRRPEIMAVFVPLMGDANSKRFIQNVIVLVETAEPGDYSLQNCSNRSIVRAALRAAIQKVSVDPAEREAYLIPRRVKRVVNGVEQKVLEACFSFHYQEIENRAWRTNRYSQINITPIYDGTEIFVNLYTGLHELQMESGANVTVGSARVLASWGKKDGKKRIGWLGYYKTTWGREKTIYMTVEEIYAQVMSGNPYYKSSLMWSKHAEIGERKTVLLALLRLADLKAHDMMAVKAALETIDSAENPDDDLLPDEKGIDEKILDGEAEYIMDENAQALAVTHLPASRTEKENFEDLFGKDPEPTKTYQDLPKAAFPAVKLVQRPAGAPAPVTPESRPYPPEILRAKYLKAVSNYIMDKSTCTEIDRKIVAAAIDGIFDGEKTSRYETCKWLTGGTSSTQKMSAAEVKAFMKMLGAKSFEDAPLDESIQEFRQAHAAALVAAGQQELI